MQMRSEAALAALRIDQQIPDHARHPHACFALLCLRFADASMPGLFGIFFIYAAFYCVSFMSLKHAGTHAHEFPMEGSIVSDRLIVRFNSIWLHYH
jgi:hypothetical protein